MGRLRQGGGGFECQILVCVRGLPISEVACALANPPLISQPPPFLPRKGAKSPIYLSHTFSLTPALAPAASPITY